uniref:Uncharacterized protein n=1 Tax=Rhizophora mucronata TaxID=61149 RepID=A0A2P2JUB6_RHIMU
MKFACDELVNQRC